MGNAARKAGELPDVQTGLTEREKKLIKDSWHNFCSENREYGVLLFLSLFVKHPEYLPLFKNFRCKHVAELRDDPAFRAHGCAIGYHLTSMVDSLGDPATFEVLVRRNATEHLRRKGVRPFHFQVLGDCLVDVLQAKDDRGLTPAALEAWKKFISYMVAITEDVYKTAGVELDVTSAASSPQTSSSVKTEATVSSPSTRSGSQKRTTTPKKKDRPERKERGAAKKNAGGSESHNPDVKSRGPPLPQETVSPDAKKGSPKEKGTHKDMGAPKVKEK